MKKPLWSVQDARETYAVEHWGDGYFDIDEQGCVVACPRGTWEGGQVALPEVAAAVRREGLSLPVLVRFTDILRDRVRRLKEAFAAARADLSYQGIYTPVYPIKVNQQRKVIEGILGDGSQGVGLEAGSKTELLAILALAPSGTIICNGYKDRAYIRLALIGQRLGLEVYIVVEKMSELALILEEAQSLSVEPRLGVRVRLSSIGAGKWQNSGGDKSKFGLCANEILRLLDTLREAGRLHWLKLMHFHIGSQVANINDVKAALREAARYYAELCALGAGLEVVDVGGGLGVDYEGTRSTHECSMNYSIYEYAHGIVRAFGEICAACDLPHPAIVTESGRAMSAHHAVLVTHVIDIERALGEVPGQTVSQARVVQDLADLWRRLPDESAPGIWHDAQFDLQEARTEYIQGKIGLQDLAEGERFGSAIRHGVRERLDVRLRAHRELLDELNETLADKLFCNFSLFQSMPDAWGIGQIFPVMPLHRLDEAPTRRAVIQDLTCDSDGRIDAYIDRQSIETTLPVHPLRHGEPYLLGFFLVGAYQEILGDMHNLFGDTHSVNVELDGAGGWRLTHPLKGDGADDLLRYVHIDPEEIERAFRRKLADAVIPAAQRKRFESELIAGLRAYTYLEEPDY